MAAAFLAATRAEDLDPDPGLRLLSYCPSAVDPPVVADPSALGTLHERLVAAGERKSRGVWYTPAWLAEDLVGRVVSGPGLVSDPACGGGAFLLAAAEQRGSVEELWGCDVDPLAVAVCEAALWWWSARRGAPVVAGERVVVGDALTGVPIPPSSAVVGNPPFLGQLKRTTSAGSDRRNALRERFGDVLRPYTDEAWLFLLAAVEANAPGGRTALVQPRSLLGARDAATVRAAIDERAVLDDVWLDDGTTFGAAVHACAPVLVRGGEGSPNDWTSALVAELGVPDADLRAPLLLGDRAEIVAGFRDEYYGLVGAVREDGDGPRLVTAGAVDPLRLRSDPIRFARRRWTRAGVDVAAVEGRARRWLEVQRGPKLLVATQTRVLEAVVDHDGSLVASVPVIVVRPQDPDQLWHLAAAIHAPVVSAWLLRRTAGTALANDACKPTASVLAELPLPVDDALWDTAAGLARDIAGGADCWEEFAAVADAAHGVTDGVAARWWLDRLPLRSRA